MCLQIISAGLGARHCPFLGEDQGGVVVTLEQDGLPLCERRQPGMASESRLTAAGSSRSRWGARAPQRMPNRADWALPRPPNKLVPPITADRHTVTKFSTRAEAIGLANSVEYGLANSVWSKNTDTLLYTAKALRSGTAYAKATIDGIPQMPFGGYKASSVGREMGEAGFEEFTELKSIRGISCSGRGVGLGSGPPAGRVAHSTR